MALAQREPARVPWEDRQTRWLVVPGRLAHCFFFEPPRYWIPQITMMYTVPAPRELTPFVVRGGRRRRSVPVAIYAARWARATAAWRADILPLLFSPSLPRPMPREAVAEHIARLDSLFVRFRDRVSASAHADWRIVLLHFRQWKCGTLRAPMEVYMAFAELEYLASWDDVAASYAWAARSVPSARDDPAARLAIALSAFSHSLQYLPDVATEFAPTGTCIDDWQYPPRAAGCRRADCEDLQLECALFWPRRCVSPYSDMPVDYARVISNYRAPLIAACHFDFDDVIGPPEANAHAVCVLISREYWHQLAGTPDPSWPSPWENVRDDGSSAAAAEASRETLAPMLLIDGTRLNRPDSTRVAEREYSSTGFGAGRRTHALANGSYGFVTDLLETTPPGNEAATWVGCWQFWSRATGSADWKLGARLEHVMRGDARDLQIRPARVYREREITAARTLARLGVPPLGVPRARTGPGAPSKSAAQGAEPMAPRQRAFLHSAHEAMELLELWGGAETPPRARLDSLHFDWDDAAGQHSSEFFEVVAYDAL